MKDNRSQSSDLLTTAEVALLIRRSRFYVQTRWPQWSRWGIYPIKVGGTGRMLFRRSDIEKLVSQWQQVGLLRSNERANESRRLRSDPSGSAH